MDLIHWYFLNVFFPFFILFPDFSFFTTLYVLVFPKASFLGGLFYFMSTLVIDFKTMNLTTTQMPLFPKCVFLLELQLHISDHLCDTAFNYVTKGNSSLICLKLNLFYSPINRVPASFSFISDLIEWDYNISSRCLETSLNLFSSYVINNQVMSLLFDEYFSGIFCLLYSAYQSLLYWHHNCLSFFFNYSFIHMCIQC
jgi:hypothetical protein